MRILHVTNMYPIPERTGFGIFVRNQVESLNARGIENDVVVVKGYESKWQYISGRRSVRKSLQTAKYDLVHVHYGLTTLATYWIKSVPVVISYCGSDLMDPIQRRISKALAHSGSRHVVESKVLKEALCIETADIIPSGVNLRTFFPMNQSEARKKLGLFTSSPIVVFVASPKNQIKNFGLAERVLGLVRGTMPDVQLIVVQGKSQQGVALYLNAADVLLLTSRWEGSPNVVKEALACSLPIVSTDVGDVRERLEGVTHSHVGPPDPDVLAEHVRELVTARVRSNGFEKVKEVSEERIAERLELLYRETIGSFVSR